MRLLADEDFPKPIVDILRAAFHDVLWARTDCAGWGDAVVLDFAESEGRIVLTADSDFWQFAVLRQAPLGESGVVLFRVHPATPKNMAPLIRAFIHDTGPWAGFFRIIGADGPELSVEPTDVKEQGPPQKRYLIHYKGVRSDAVQSFLGAVQCIQPHFDSFI